MDDNMMDLIVLLVGTGLLAGSVIGLLRGGELPFLPRPRSLRPALQVVLAFVLIVSMAMVLEAGSPDFLGRLLGI